MQCEACGVELPNDAAFCHKCGFRTAAAASGTNEAPSQQPDGLPPPTAAQSRLRPSGHAPDDVEEEIWAGGFSAKAMIGGFLLAGLVSIALVMVGVAMSAAAMVWNIIAGAIGLIWLERLGRLAYRKINVRYRLTNQRFIHESGILRRVTDRVEAIDMDDITFEQGIIERFFGVGTIKVSSSDRTHPELWLHGIDDVKSVATLLDNARRRERVRRGLHIEAV